jgi:ubiquinone/menaquinone biosynthesis C-methylase UbiE
VRDISRPRDGHDLKRQLLDHDRVFTDPAFVDRYAKEQRQVSRRMNPSIIKAFRELGFHSGRLLDAGCGPGYEAIALKQSFPNARVTGIDLSEPLLDLARRNAADADLGDVITYQSGDVEHIPFADDSFDAVLSVFMFHIVADPVMMCNEIERVLRSDGHLLMIDIRRSWLLGLLERSFRTAYTPREAWDIIKTTALRPLRLKTTPIWWGVSG